MEPEAFVYLWRDSINKKFYLGYHKGSIDDNYAHSSTVMESFTMNTKPDGFKRRILAVGSSDEMMKLEQMLLVNRKERGRWEKYHNIATSLFPYLWDDPKYREKMNQVVTEQWNDPEFKSMMRERSQERLRELMKDPEYRKQRSEEASKRSQALWADPEFRERHSRILKENNKRMWEDPEFKKKMVKVQRKNNRDLWNTSEYREMHSTKMKKLWADPEYRKQMSEQTKQQHKDPKYRKIMREIWNDENFKKKISIAGQKALKNKWENDPEFRRKQTEMLRGLNKVRATCSVCGHESTKPAISRWHNDKCKHK